MRTIDWLDGEVVIVDQALLPLEERLVRLHTVNELVKAISTLSVRGAMALGVAGAMGIALAALRAREAGTDEDTAIDRAAADLNAARPTAVNLGWASPKRSPYGTKVRTRSWPGHWRCVTRTSPPTSRSAVEVLNC